MRLISLYKKLRSFQLINICIIKYAGISLVKEITEHEMDMKCNNDLYVDLDIPIDKFNMGGYEVFHCLEFAKDIRSVIIRVLFTDDDHIVIKYPSVIPNIQKVCLRIILEECSLDYRVIDGEDYTSYSISL